MRFLISASYALGVCAAVAMLAGCSSGSQSSLSSSSGVIPTQPAFGRGAAHRVRMNVQPEAVIKEFLLLHSGSGPNGITLGPDGNLWFVETAGNRIGRITPAGKIKEYSLPRSGSNPENIAAGSDDNLWFTESSGNAIGRIKAKTGAIT
jgi:streptogramin lyase